MKSFKLVVNNREYTVEIDDISQSPLTVMVNGQTYQVEVQREPTTSAEPPASVVREADPRPAVVTPPVAPKPRVEAAADAVTAPLPCKVLEIKVKEGNQVKAGDVLFLVESMKMEITVPAPRDGMIKAIRVEIGQTVKQGAVLVDME